MKKGDLYILLKDVNKSNNKVTLGVYFVILSPMIFTVLCAYRKYSMNIINALGIGWILLCVVLSLPLLIKGMVGIVKYVKVTGEEIYVSKITGDYIYDWKKSTSKTLVNLFTVGIILCVSSIVPIITVSMLRLSNYVYVAYSYIFIFLVAGAGLSIIIGAAIKTYLMCHLKIVISKEIVDKHGSVHEIEKRKITRKNYIIKTVIVLAAIICLVIIMSQGTWYIQPYIATIPSVEHRNLQVSYNKNSGVYSIKNEENTDFKILQLTDIHLGGSLLSYSKDINALETVYTLIEDTTPDMIIVTGDFVFPLGIQSYSFNNYTPMMQFASFMRNIGIPWAFVYGNHDTEFVASHSEEELNQLFMKLSYETTHTLMYPNVQPEITGRSNQVILVKNGDDTINQAVYLLDSNSYTSVKINDYDYIHDDQVQWYEDSVREISQKENQLISSLIFTHMPLQEYESAYNLYKDGSTEVKYYYGEIGEKDEEICCSKYKSKLFDTAVKLGSTKGIFVGYDHYNNISMEYKNIRLTYGMSIDYLAMLGISKKTKQRGGTLITLHSDSTIDIKQVPFSK